MHLVLPDLLRTDPSGEKFSGRAKVLKELVEHHADEEEKRNVSSREEDSVPRGADDAGQLMQSRKQELLRSH
jgi:hypothetical protein